MVNANIQDEEDYAGRLSIKELSTLLRVSGSLASTLDLGEILRISIESACELLELNTGAIYTLANQTLFLGATLPPLPPDLPQELLTARIIDHPHIQKTIESRGPIFLKDTRIAELSPAEMEVVSSRKLISILYFPLLLKEDAIGVFILGTTGQIREFTAKEIDICFLLSNQVALALSNARLYQQAQQAITDLHQSYDSTLASWSQVLDMRDHATDEHTKRVARMTVDLARQVGVSEAECIHIRRGALLHDIGKMQIPDYILQKTGPLSPGERAIMRTHPERAFQLLSQIAYLQPDIDIPYCHHEWWNGRGYPRKLKGNAIPLAARLFAVVDVYDALTSDRPYRKAWSKARALKYIQAQSGKHFDPDVVPAFLKMIESWQ